MPRNTKLSITQRIIDAFADTEILNGIRLSADSFSYVADPHHDGVYAIRLTKNAVKRLDLDIETERDYIMHPDGELEQGQFEQWPPEARIF